MLYQLSYGSGLVPAGFEPAHPKIVDLESTALDHSAMAPLGLVLETHFEHIIKSLNVAVYVSKKPPAGLEPAALRLKV